MRMFWIVLLSVTAVFSVQPEDPAVKKAWEVLKAGPHEPSLVKKLHYINALGVPGINLLTVAMLEELLKDKYPEVRQAAAAVLGDIKSVKSIPALRAALDDDSPEVSFTAARSLWIMGDGSGKAVFLQVLAGERGDSAGFMKGSLRDARNKLHDPKALTMLGVKEGVGLFLGPAAMGITVFEELRKDASASARTLAAAALATDKDPATIQNLEAALEDKNWIVRAAAAKALAIRGSSKSVPKLAELLKDTENAQYMAASAIVKIDADSKRRKVKR
jgi:HEAT repeat protein